MTTKGSVLAGPFFKINLLNQDEGMLLTVKKQVEETVELKVPAYYKDYLDNYHYINEAGELVSVRQRSITSWLPNDGKFYTDAIASLLKEGKPCTQEEFDKAYMDVIEKFENATGIQL